MSMDMGEKQASLLLGNKFEFLFEDAKKRQDHQDKVTKMIADTECTFHPNINVSQQQHSSASSINNEKAAKDRPATAAMVAEVANTVKEKIDPRTGQAYFKPKVGRPPRNDRNSACLPIGDYLYAQNKRKEEIISRKKDEEKVKTKASANVSHVRDESNKIIEAKKTENFVEVFQLLDKDADGIISAKSVNISGNTAM